MINKTKTIAFISLAIALVVSCLCSYGIYKVVALGSAYEEGQLIIAEQQTKEKTYFDVQQMVEATREQRTELASFFISDQDTVTFITDIEKLALASGLKLEATQLAVDPKTDKSEAYLNIGFTFTGPEQAVKAMAYFFETIPYRKEIPELNLTAIDGAVGTWEGKVAMRIMITP